MRVLDLIAQRSASFSFPSHLEVWTPARDGGGGIGQGRL